MNPHGPSRAPIAELMPHQVDQADPEAVDSLIPVELHLWAFAEPHLLTAHIDASLSPSAHRWRIVNIREDVGPPCPIPMRDDTALAQESDYEWKWAVRRAA